MMTDTDTVAGTGTYGAPRSEALAFEIVEAIAAERGTDPLAIPPLNDYVDVDALVALFESAHGREAGTLDVRFRYEDLEVHLRRDGSIDVFAASAAFPTDGTPTDRPTE